MSTPAIPIDPDIVGYQSSRPTITSDFAPGDSAIDDDEEDDEHADDHLAVASAIPRRFSKRQSQGASSSEVRRLSSTTRRRDSSSAGGAAGEGSTTGRYRSSSVTTNDGGARQRKYSTGRDSLRPVNAFHIDSSILHAGEGSSSQGVDTLHAGTPSPQPPSPLDITNDDSAGTSSATSRRPSNQNHSHEFSVSAVNLSTSGSSVSTQRRPSHSAAQENGIVVHNLDKVDTKSGGSIHMPTLGETQEFDVNQQATFEVQDAANDRDTGTLSQLRSKIILAVICVAQLLDNVSMTSVNMALPAVSKELNIAQADQQWLVSAYTLTFGGFLLLAGVLSDRYGKKLVFLSGLAWLSIWVCICGGAQSMIQLVIFRALQGLGAAATVPSAVGILTSYFSGRERNLCLTIFGASGALGFVVGLIYGGVLTDVLSWRWVFWLSSPIGFATALAGYFVLPNTRPVHNERKKSLDFIGAAAATSGLILLTFVLSSGEVYGWSTSYIIVILIIAVALLAAFPLIEKYVKDPIMPNYLWKQKGFAATWVVGFLVYCWWQTLVLYNTYISQNVFHLSALRTSLQFIPMGLFGAIASYGVGIGVNYIKIKTLILSGLALSFISVIPVAVMKVEQGFWASVFPSCIIGVVGISIVYNAVSVSMMASVPPEARSLAGGMINTAFQVGAGAGLAIAAAVVSGVTKGKDEADLTVLLDGYKAGIWTTGGFCGAAFALALFGVQGGMVEVGPVH